MKKEQQPLSEEIRQELESLSPELARLREQPDGMRVPDGYFQRLEAEVMERIGPELPKAGKTAPKRESWLDIFLAPLQILLNPRYATAMAALLVLIAAGLWLLQPSEQTNSPDLGMLSNDEINTYVRGNIDEFELELLLEYTQTNDARPGLLLEDQFTGDEEMDEYLDEILDDLDISDIEDLL